MAGFNTNYVLIDYENVQPKNLELLSADHFEVFVFIGAKQSKISVDLATTLQSFGQKGHYIKVTGIGSDALDFHIAYYIGELGAKYVGESKSKKDGNVDAEVAGAWFHIISKDKGFDPLIDYLKTRGLNVARRELITDIPLFRISNKASSQEKVDAVVTNLTGRGHSKPRKEKTLRNTINSIFKEPLPEAQLTKLIAHLQAKKYIKISAGKVTYNLSKPDD